MRRARAWLANDLKDLREWLCGVVTGHDPIPSLKPGVAVTCRRCRREWRAG